VPTGMLGLDWARENGAIASSASSPASLDIDARPLGQPACASRPAITSHGRITGLPLDPNRDPWAAFEGPGPRAGRDVLTVRRSPDAAQRGRTARGAGGEKEAAEGRKKAKEKEGAAAADDNDEKRRGPPDRPAQHQLQAHQPAGRDGPAFPRLIREHSGLRRAGGRARSATCTFRTPA